MPVRRSRSAKPSKSRTRSSSPRTAKAFQKRSAALSARSKKVVKGARRAAPSRSGKRINLMIVDDHPMWRETLRKLVAHSGVGTVVAEAADGTEAIQRARATTPDLVIMDINLPTMDGVEATRRLIEERPELKVLVLASSDERTQVLEAVHSGASGYLLKTSEPAEVVEAVRRVQKGEFVFPPALASMVLGEMRRLAKEAPAPPTLRVNVADGDVLAREGLSKMLTEAGFAAVGSTGDAEELIDQIASNLPDVLIIDAAMASTRFEGRGPLLEHVHSRFPKVAILVMSPDPEAAEALSLLSRGASIGYLLKDRISSRDDLADVIGRLAQGGSVLDPQVVSDLVDRPAKPRALDELTGRERDVLGLMAEGRSNQAIAELLFLGPKTVETHVRSIFTKLGLEPAADVHRRVLAVIAYLRSTS